MRDVSLWRSLLGVEKTVIERVEFDEDEEVLVAHVRPIKRQAGRCGICRRRSPGRVGGGGDHWIWAPSARSWRPTCRGWPAVTMGWWSQRCRGLVTTPVIPALHNPGCRGRRRVGPQIGVEVSR